MQIGIIGLGLMGGSLGLALHRYIPEIKVVGHDFNERHLKYARKNNIIDVTFSNYNLKELDIIFIAVPVRSIIDVLKRIRPNLNLNKTLITDMGSTKSFLDKKINKLFPEVKYIGGHPITGREVSGPGGAVADLYKDSNYILINPKNNEMKGELKKIENILIKIGCELSYLTPDKHDHLLAFSSHLPQIVATTLVSELKMMEDINPEISDLIGSGFIDMTRIAASDPDMWTDIFLTNKMQIINQIDSLIKRLTNFKETIKSKDEKAIRKIMNTARDKRLSLEGDKDETKNRTS